MKTVQLLTWLFALVGGLAQVRGDVFTNYRTMDKLYPIDTNVEPAVLKGGPASRPAELDPAGNWGEVTAGLQLGLRFKTNTFAIGEPIIGYAFIRNATTNAVSYMEYMEMHSPGCDYTVVGPEGQKLLYRLGIPLLGHSLSRPVSPGDQHRVWVRLDKAFDLSRPGKYQVTAVGKYPITAEKRSVPFRSAPAVIQILGTNAPGSGSNNTR